MSCTDSQKARLNRVCKSTFFHWFDDVSMLSLKFYWSKYPLSQGCSSLKVEWEKLQVDLGSTDLVPTTLVPILLLLPWKPLGGWCIASCSTCLSVYLTEYWGQWSTTVAAMKTFSEKPPSAPQVGPLGRIFKTESTICKGIYDWKTDNNWCGYWHDLYLEIVAYWTLLLSILE